MFKYSKDGISVLSVLDARRAKKIDCLHINPGAAGKQGWQQQRTLIKVTIDDRTFKDLEIVELK